MFEEIEISGAQYKLRGVVRCHNHFTCAVKDHNTCKWTYFDDLSVNLQSFPIFGHCDKFTMKGGFFQFMS